MCVILFYVLLYTPVASHSILLLFRLPVAEPLASSLSQGPGSDPGLGVRPEDRSMASRIGDRFGGPEGRGGTDGTGTGSRKRFVDQVGFGAPSCHDLNPKPYTVVVSHMAPGVRLV